MTATDPPWIKAAETAIEETFEQLTPLHGGDFARAYRVVTVSGKHLFAKTHANPPAFFFSTEATGLSWLRATATVNVPEVLAVSDDPPFLLLEWIDIGTGSKGNEIEFGRSLANLHAQPQKAFGRQDERTTGSLAVPNQPCESWSLFFATQRLQPLCQIAGERSSLPAGVIDSVLRLSEQLELFELDGDPPSLLHGDLWAGNRVVDCEGHSWMIDPAAHRSHREFDLAMMRLFGGFGSECHAAYQETLPLKGGWQERVALHQLAPLIVHAIKFGGHYVAATSEAIQQYQ